MTAGTGSMIRGRRELGVAVSSNAAWMVLSAAVAGTILIVLVLAAVGAAVVARRPGRAVPVPVREDHLRQVVRWARRHGYRWAPQDTAVAGRFAGDPFVHDRFSYANATVWVPVRGHLMEIVEYEYYDAPRIAVHRVISGRVCRLRLVLVPVTDRRLLDRLAGWLATPHHVHGVRLRVENGTLIGWETGYLTVDSALRQAGIVADFLAEAAG